jgi:hypothetical protein
MEGWSRLLERIHWPLPPSENLTAHYLAEEPLMIKAETYTQCGLMSLGNRVDQPSYPQPEIIGEGKLGVGKVHPARRLLIETGHFMTSSEYFHTFLYDKGEGLL